MRTIQTTLYQFDELPTEQAKERARDWLRGLTFSDSSDWDSVYEDAENVAKLLGIEIDRRSYRTVGGAGGTEPAIFFSGFWSQGDGAYFEGSYRYAKGAPAAIKAYAPQDAELLRIAKALQDVQRRSFYRLRAKCTHRGHYNHSGCMAVEVYDEENPYADLGDAEDEITQLLRDFADWIYEKLEAEHDYQTSDEQIEESIRANEYDFNEDGSRA